MSTIRKSLMPVLAVALIAGTTALTVQPGVSAEQKRYHQELTASDGTEVYAFDTGQGFMAYLKSPQTQQYVDDGFYKLTNGGAIKVKDGRIIWDANGVIENYKMISEIQPGMG